MHPCTLLPNFKDFLWKTTLLRPPTSITNYHTKVSWDMTLHYTESLHRQSSTGWLKPSSPEFPQLASVIKVDEGRQLARRAQKWSSAWGSLCSVHGERLLCLVPFTLQNMHCLELTQLSPALLLLVPESHIVESLLPIISYQCCPHRRHRLYRSYGVCFYNKCLKWIHY